MRKRYVVLIFIGALFLDACGSENPKANDNAPSSMEEPYFDLIAPGMEAEPLELDSISLKGWELGGIHAPNMEEFYLTSTVESPIRPLVISFRKENRVWRKYEFHATGGNTLYSRDKYIERTDTGWSALKSLGEAFDTIPIMRLTASSKGTLVFDERDSIGTIRYSRLIDGKREAPKPFGEEINTGKWTAHPFIAQDETYIIWDSEREGGYGDSDMYISFKQSDGSWGAAINFGDKINTDGEDGGGYVTPDGKYLSYCPRCSPPYDRMWVDAEIIETLRPKTEK
ncbi:PD40 domain-containing protein [Flagellimonas sp. CMM7]|uniref:PD40 domain-containing protein n=1 Tax=Flagellimonas sp. CMM7 TaxID=2654676 RepID=UPI0013D7E0E0|nr:PD40 domain-containing protein [Flagellimonas sp. CMM7]UII79542.1 PD40 domain-containing protein [Flagellimonas sp. CMM7]